MSEPDTISQISNPAAESLANYLRGYGQANPEALVLLASRPDWAQLASQELDRRTLHLLEVFDTEVLQGLASGNVNFEEVANQVLRERTRK